MRFSKSDGSNVFFDLLTTQANHLVRGAQLLARIHGARNEDRFNLRDELHEVEHLCDEALHELSSKINQTFVTPFDRDDLTFLAGKLDDCMDFMDEAGDLIVLYKVGDLPRGVVEQLNVIQRCADLTAQAMPKLKSLGGLRDYWIEINRLENEGDKAYRRVLSEVFDTYENAIEVIKVKDIVEALEKACDSFEGLANGIETIAIKES
ncbi:DUF47 domain-containing protein [Gleimia hominis]|uniref:DUF47 family protein n=1 Tax=Gleimia hominis TaxID=595468 RepID=A0ABU3I7V6_9ACTO|nr:DUF47 family protein [Gleimia hominis]MDT3766468.1 DUF47 family protein [Gleimia hominis]WIK63853.1 DUF47 family protein [Gleimia hominis]